MLRSLAETRAGALTDVAPEDFWEAVEAERDGRPRRVVPGAPRADARAAHRERPPRRGARRGGGRPAHQRRSGAARGGRRGAPPRGARGAARRAWTRAACAACGWAAVGAGRLEGHLLALDPPPGARRAWTCCARCPGEGLRAPGLGRARARVRPGPLALAARPAPGAGRALARARRRPGTLDGRRARARLRGERRLPALGRAVRAAAAGPGRARAREQSTGALAHGHGPARPHRPRPLAAYRAYAARLADVQRATWGKPLYTCPMPKVPRQKAEKKPAAATKPRSRRSNGATAVAEPKYEHVQVDVATGRVEGRARRASPTTSGCCWATSSPSWRSTPPTPPRRSTASRSRRRSCSPATATPTSAAPRARTSSCTPSAWRRSARACASTPPRCAPRCCTTRWRTPAPRSTRCARSSATRWPRWSTA